MFQNFLGCSPCGESFYAENLEQHSVIADVKGQAVFYVVAEAADWRMIFENKGGAYFFEDIIKPVVIYIVEPGHVNDFEREAFAFIQQFRGDKRFIEHNWAVGENGCVGFLFIESFKKVRSVGAGEGDTFSRLENVVFRESDNSWGRADDKSEDAVVGRFVDAILKGGFCLGGVAGLYNLKVRECAQK